MDDWSDDCDTVRLCCEIGSRDEASFHDFTLWYARDGCSSGSSTVFKEAGKCWTRLIELHDSASNVTFAMPSSFIRGLSVRRGMEVCSSTSLQSRSLAYTIHWQNGFRVRGRHDHQLREPLLPIGTSRAKCWVIARSPSNRIRAQGCLH